MPKKKQIETKINPLYQAPTVDIMLVVWVEAIQSKVPVSITSCIKDFYNYFNITEEDYPMDCAQVIYQRMRKMLNDWERDNKKQSLPYD